MSVVDLDGIHQKLLDINGDSHYFESEIFVKLKPEDASKKILCGIVSQDDLDNGNMNLDEITNGTYSITIANGNVKQPYQNYFLCIKSTEPVSGVTIDINTKDLPPPIEPEPFQQPPATKDDSSKQQTIFYVKILLSLIVLVVGITFLKKFWKE